MPPSTPQPFAQSAIWQLQDDYFASQGPLAWGRNQVPSYITSNPSIAADYARLVFAFFRDLSRQGRTQAPVRVLELGGGSGQFAFYFLKALHDLCRDLAFDLPPFTYVFSDFPPTNLDHVYQHPRMQPYLNHGTLSVARLDARNPLAATHFPSGEPLLPELVEGPLLVIGNYFFDSIPQDLFRCRGYDLEAVSLALQPKEETPSEARLTLENSELEYHYMPLGQMPYQNRELDELLESYTGKFTDTHLLFPHIGLQLLQQLLRILPAELILLSADKGEQDLADLDLREAPQLSLHGSFSLQVNYHALSEYCRRRKGEALSPGQWQHQIQHHCLIFPGKQPAQNGFTELRHAFQHDVGRFGPDNYFGVKKIMEKFGAKMSFRELVAAVRFSRFDPRLFEQLLPRWQVIADRIAAEKSPKVVHSAGLVVLPLVVKVWENFYPLPSGHAARYELGNQIARLLRTLGLEQEAEAFGVVVENGGEEE